MSCPITQAWRVRRLITMAGEKPAAGVDLLHPLQVQDNALLVSTGGRIVYVGEYAQKHIPIGACVQDLGDVTMVPAAVNAHTHTQLAHLAGRTVWHQGFVSWLQSLVPLLRLPLDAHATHQAAAEIRAQGTAAIGDYTSHGLAMTRAACEQAGQIKLDCTSFIECFGFAHDTAEFPPHCTAAIVPNHAWQDITLAGHALYSTSMHTLQKAWRWCQGHDCVFSLHLAESPEETQMLADGAGALYALFAAAVLPEQWQAPKTHPVRLAAQYGLLGETTLAVHCVQCDAEDRALLAATGTKICLCPRSNAHLAVGTAPVEQYMRTSIILCLGTDGLTSNVDGNVWEEALWLMRQHTIPVQALLRMLTVNGAAALGYTRRGSVHVGQLALGGPARWAVLPHAMNEHI